MRSHGRQGTRPLPRHGAARFLAGLALVGALTVWAEAIHVVIPAGPGGGLDGTARESGRVLKDLALVESVSFENLSGGGGGRAMGWFMENAGRHDFPLLVNSAPLIVRSLHGLFPYSFRDLTPVAALIADYGVFVVAADAPATSWEATLARLRNDPGAIVVGGGSVRGSLDHIVLALALEAGGINPREVRYLPYDGGGKAMLALLGGEVAMLSTGLGETMPFIEADEVRPLAVTSPERIGGLDTPTLTELGYPLSFANWRGMFGDEGMPAEDRSRAIEWFRALRASPQWQEVLARRGWASLDHDGEDYTRFLEQQEEQLRATMQALGFVR